MVTTQVIAKVSVADLLTTSNLVRQSILPEVLALKIPASVKAPVASPGSNVEVYVITPGESFTAASKASRLPT